MISSVVSPQQTGPPPADPLGRGRALVEPALRTATERMHPALAQIVAYHSGWTTDTGEPVIQPSGKRVRAILALLSAGAAGAPAETAIRGAVAVELLHAFSLLHDDIMDGDRVRRGRPAAWTVYGTGPALLTGDALLALALDEIAATNHTAAMGMFTETTCALCWGQAEDARFERQPRVTIDEYLRMVDAKTGSLITLACTIGAVLADAPSNLISGLTRIGHHLGIAFQADDDILGIWGDPAVTGKPVYADIARRKKTLPILLALDSATDQGAELHALMATLRPLEPDELIHCADLIEQAGGRARTEHESTQRRAEACAIMRALSLPNVRYWESVIDVIGRRQS